MNVLKTSALQETNDSDKGLFELVFQARKCWSAAWFHCPALLHNDKDRFWAISGFFKEFPHSNAVCDLFIGQPKVGLHAEGEDLPYKLLQMTTRHQVSTIFQK